MFEITEDLSWQCRKKRAYKRLTSLDASKQIGISRQTLRLIEDGRLKKTTKTVYLKVTNWLLKEDEL